MSHKYWMHATVYVKNLMYSWKRYLLVGPEIFRPLPDACKAEDGGLRGVGQQR